MREEEHEEDEEEEEDAVEVHDNIYLGDPYLPGSPTPSMVYGAGLLMGKGQSPLTPLSPTTNIHIHLPAATPVFTDPRILPSTFPTTLPITRLSEAEQKVKYGLGSKAPPLVKEQLRDFVRWSTDAVQLSRSGTYSAAVQFSTTDKHEVAILAYLGYLHNVRMDVEEERVNLNAYASPIWIAGFISYLMARNVGRGHIIKNVSLAKKVNNWLVSGESNSTLWFVDMAPSITLSPPPMSSPRHQRYPTAGKCSHASLASPLAGAARCIPA
jgi:hypothetical protein